MHIFYSKHTDTPPVSKYIMPVVTDKVEIARIKATMKALHEMLPPDHQECAIRYLRRPRKERKRIPKKSKVSSCSASLISNTTSPRRKHPSKRRRCNHCPSLIAHTHDTEHCRHWTENGRNKHHIKMMDELFKRENEKIRLCYKAHDVEEIFEPKINYWKQNCDTWDEIFACKSQLDQLYLDNPERITSHYRRLALPNEEQIQFYGLCDDTGAAWKPQCYRTLYSSSR